MTALPAPLSMRRDAPGDAASCDSLWPGDGALFDASADAEDLIHDDGHNRDHNTGPHGCDDEGLVRVEPDPAALSSLRATAADDAALAGWIGQIVGRDERALAALYDATVSRVYGLALRIVRRPAWAEEVVEETYFQVWRQAPRFDAARGRPLTWLLGMARSRAIDALRREARFEHEPLDSDDAAPLQDTQSPGVAHQLDLASGQAALDLALQSLGAQPRQLVAMAFYRGLSHEEIAAQMALPLGTVKSQIRRSLITLRNLLGDAGLQLLAV